MNKSMFFKQYTLWLPRWWVIVLSLMLTALLVLFGLRNAAYYLAVSEPKHGNYLIVEGWLDDKSLDQALALFNSNSGYQFIITTGGPDERYSNTKHLTYAEQSADYLLAKGLPSKEIIVISTPTSAQARTFLSAVMVREWFAVNNIENATMDIFTGSVHARRTHLLYTKAFGPINHIGIYASNPSRFDLSTWWQTSEGAKSVSTELIALIWTILFFDPGVPGSYQEKWG